MQYSFFGAEFELVEFLEANGYDVTYISGVDTDRFGLAAKEPPCLHLIGSRRVLVG